MSEYQFYEFLAVDRPLDGAEQAEVRALSSRARVTATGFADSYEWGDFGGDPERLVERYYDAHLHVADWGARRVMLRLPERHLPLAAVEPYLLDGYAEAWTAGKHVILDLRNEEEDDWDEGAEDALPAIAGVRPELAAGDLRPLYLAWLSALTAWELEDDDEEEFQRTPEPPLPAGLGALSAPQRALADFLRVDADLLAVAAGPSAPLPPAPRLAPLIAALPEADKDDLLLRLAAGEDPFLRAELLRRLGSGAPPAAAGSPRSAADLLDAAAERRQQRKRARG